MINQIKPETVQAISLVYQNKLFTSIYILYCMSCCVRECLDNKNKKVNGNTMGQWVT